ncbi:acyl-CoA thioesterase [Alkalihalobacterium chitinilyticum]|uniref:Acyl-CoA thioesterase n=1 Tax=Alkalihalobacterium chitinilyticum TaxID=2980103 RepID=A0ABT5VI14_9BACI|nr:thioesterase family protein [Alkalihalobacterium chitinilyticum]MDE5413879.1 acyl-CoA thioesterase [Alkalihalobacterium chitinilyticum]
MKHEIQVKVRACETDGLGHVSNISYFIYLEEARVEFFKLFTSEMDMKSWNFILAHTGCDFVNQAYFDEILTVATSVEHVGNSSFEVSHHIYNRHQQLIAKGKAIVVYFDFEDQKSKPIPEPIKEKLNQFSISTPS